MKMKVKPMLLCGLFAALTAILSQLAIPIGPVPINLALLSVILAAGLLGPKLGTVSQIVYVLVGMIGLPVFSGMQGGLGVLAGPTGGYLAGYILCALTAGILIQKFGAKIPGMVLSMAAGILVCYLFGTVWFILLTKSALLSALTTCVLPFLPGDCIKIALAVFLVFRLRPRLTF